MSKIAIGSDHAGFEMKEKVKALLNSSGHQVTDFGTSSTESADYPDFAHPVASAVEQSDTQLGILLCGSANGVAMTANKHKGVRAAICWTEELAALARQHNDANILCLPARFIDDALAAKIVNRFLATPFEGGRHARRRDKI
jgi:ribose 5-phosphate isomerase B